MDLTRRVTVLVTDDMYQSIEQRAASYGLSVSAYLRYLCKIDQLQGGGERA